MSAGASVTAGSIDIMESAADVAPVGVTRLARKGGVLLQSTDGGAYAAPPSGAAATAVLAATATTALANTGPTTTTVTATETIAALRAVTATGVEANAVADVLPPIGVTVAGAANAATCTVVTQGPAAVISAATPGTKYWLDIVAGIITTTKPSATGNALWLLGIAVSATVLQVQISYLGTVP